MVIYAPFVAPWLASVIVIVVWPPALLAVDVANGLVSVLVLRIGVMS